MNRQAPPPDAVARVGVVRFSGAVPASGDDEVAVERPLVIRIAGTPLVVTMRTPGSDDELVAGFLIAEGIVKSAADIERVARATDVADPDDVMDVWLRAEGAERLPTAVRRGTLTTASCGVCGRTTIEDLVARCQPISSSMQFIPHLVGALTDLLSRAQPLFARTGGLHAAAVVNGHGEILVVREDVGRHNAVDKAIGRMALDQRLPLGEHALVVSGRTSFEIVQKAIAAGIPLVAGVSAPSSLAVEVADRAGVTLVGFARAGHFNVYATASRITV